MIKSSGRINVSLYVFIAYNQQLLDYTLKASKVDYIQTVYIERVQLHLLDIFKGNIFLVITTATKIT